MFRIFLKIPTPVNLEELKNLHLSSWFSEVESKIWSLRIRKYSENGPGNGALLPTSEWKTDAQFGAKLTRLVKTESPQREISSQWTSLGNKIKSRNINFVVISLGTHVVDRVGKCPPSWISLSIQTQHLETFGNMWFRPTNDSPVPKFVFWYWNTNETKLWVGEGRVCGDVMQFHGGKHDRIYTSFTLPWPRN